TSVTIMGDADKAGQSATVKDLRALLKAGFRVQVATLPEGQDPDSWCLKKMKGEDPGEIKKSDGVLWFATEEIKRADDDVVNLGVANETNIKLLSIIPNVLMRSDYFDTLVKHFGWKRPEMLKQLNAIVDSAKDVSEIDDDGAANL